MARNGVPLAHVLLLSATVKTQPAQPRSNHHPTGTFDKGICLNSMIRTLMLSRRSPSSNNQIMTMSYLRQHQRQSHLRHHLLFCPPLSHVKSLPRLSNPSHHPQKVKALLCTNRLLPQVKMPCNARPRLKLSKLLTMLPLTVQVVELQRQRTDLIP
jgi:hypothetical protein